MYLNRINELDYILRMNLVVAVVFFSLFINGHIIWAVSILSSLKKKKKTKTFDRTNSGLRVWNDTFHSAGQKKNGHAENSIEKPPQMKCEKCKKKKEVKNEKWT